MMTNEQYKQIIVHRAMPIINACITSGTKTPDAQTYTGLTDNTKKILFTFDPKIAKRYQEEIMSIYKDLPRTYGGLSSYGYVAFDDFFSESKDPKLKTKEILLANAFINLSTLLDIVYPRRVLSDEGVLLGADAELKVYIPTRADEEKRKEFEEKRNKTRN